MKKKLNVEMVTVGAMRVMAKLSEMDKAGVQNIIPPATVKNPQYIEVKKCCASCKFRDIERSMRLRFCEKLEIEVRPDSCCDRWKISDGMKAVGSTEGRIKRREYQLFLIRVRELEAVKREKKLFVKSRSNEDIRKVFERLYGSIYVEF